MKLDGAKSLLGKLPMPVLPARRRAPPPRLRQYSGRPIRRVVIRTAVVPAIAAFCFIYGFAFALFAPAFLPMFGVPLVLLALLVVWALPDVRNPPTRVLEWLFFAFFLSLPLWPDYLAISLPGLPWITLLRLTGFPMAFLLLVCVSASAEFRRELGKGLTNAQPVTLLLILFTGLELLSIALSHNKGFSIQKFFVAQTNWTAVFFVAIYVFQKPGRMERWAKLLWATGIIVSLIALWEFRLQHVPWAGHIPSFLKIEDESVAKVLAGVMRAYTNRYRTQATFSTSLGLSEYLALVMPFVLQFAVGRYGWRLRLGAVASIPLLFYAVILTDSRLGVIGCLLSFLLFGLVLAVRLWMRSKSSLLGPAATLAYPALFFAAIGASFVVPRLKVMIWGGGAQQSSTNARVEQYNLGIPKILHNPFGYGMGMGAETLGYAPFGDLTIDAYYLSIALEYGVLGFILYYGMIGAAIFHAGRRSFAPPSIGKAEEPMFAPLVIALTSFLVIKSVFSQQDNHPVVFMMLGAVVALCCRSAAVPARSAARRMAKAAGRGPVRPPAPAPTPST